jgi:hypothetical protein
VGIIAVFGVRVESQEGREIWIVVEFIGVFYVRSPADVVVVVVVVVV